jgi:hypothetical protein
VLEMREVEAAAQKLGLQVARLEVRRAEDIAPALVKVNCQYCHKWDGSEVEGRRGDSGGRCRCPSGWPS